MTTQQKYQHPIVAAMLAIAFVAISFAGCENDVTPTDIENPKQNVTDEQGKLEALQERQQVEDKIELQLTKLNKEIDQLEQQADDVTGDVEVELRGEIAKLKTKYEHAQERLKELRAANQASEPMHTNELANETSPYLLQHAHNPVNWHPWGPAAFAKAKAENKPIFLSVGYSTCYWCHVMERESFERDDVAKILNEHFIAIKVDREERPEIDQQYMLATQLITGRGGWPNSVWLTPDGKPWMAGTYFPREQFKNVLLQLADFWKNRTDDVLEQADQMMAAIKKIGNTSLESKPISQALIDTAVSAAKSNFDRQLGGFGAQPKFPPHDNLALLIDQYRRDKNKTVADIIQITLTHMARGGVYDQLGGGFHRYSTDAQWLLPHFEKMLYDNGQLMKAYTDGYLLFDDQEYRNVVEGIYVWLEREMTSPAGGFYSAIDSESNAEEGKFYVWTMAEILEVLGPQDGQLFADVYQIQPGGNFTDEATGEKTKNNIPHLKTSIRETATQNNMDAEEVELKLVTMRGQLLDVRQQREFPHLDDKVLAAWNGLMIEALAYAGRTLDEPKYTAAAEKAANFILTSMMKDGKLQRSWRGGQAKLNGYLNDYAFVAKGLVEVYKATEEQQYLDAAMQLADTMLTDFADEQSGGFYFTAESSGDGQNDFVLRSKNLNGGGNLPSGNGMAAEVLIELERITGKSKYGAAATHTLNGLSGFMWQTASQADHLMVAAAMSLTSDPSSDSDSNLSSTVATESSTDADATFSATSVTGKVYVSRIKLTLGESFQVAVRLDIADGWHLYGLNPDVKVVKPTTVEFAETEFAKIVEIKRPSGITKIDQALEQELEIHEAQATFFIDLTVSQDATIGKHTLKFTVETQACDDHRCAAPAEHDIELELVVLPENIDAVPPRHAEIFGGK
jgi:uncharacterized protein YyaL (SSP411 family)